MFDVITNDWVDVFPCVGDVLLHRFAVDECLRPLYLDGDFIVSGMDGK